MERAWQAAQATPTATVKGDYVSVTEQSGIQAGDKGFQIDVAGNTDLQGAVIASHQTAIDNNANSLRTGTLTASDIENHSDYKASGASLSGGYAVGGGDKGKSDSSTTSADSNTQASNTVDNGANWHWQNFNGQTGVTGAGAGYSQESGSDSSTTRSGISAGTVTVADEAGQQKKAGKTADEVLANVNRNVLSGDNANSLSKNWDAEKLREQVQAQAKIVATFGETASKAAGIYASEQAVKARQVGDEEEARKWDEGGEYRVALHGSIGLLTGGLEGAVGASASAALIPSIGEEIAGLNLPRVVTDGLSTVVGGAIGALGGGQGAAAGVNQTANNYISRSPFAEVRRTVSRENARLMNECGSTCTAEDLTRIDQQMAKLEAAGNLVAIAEVSSMTQKQAQELSQTLLELMPLYGSGESLLQVVTGKATLSGEEISRVWAAVGIIPVAGGMIQRVGRTTADVVKAFAAADKVTDVAKQSGLINDANRLFKQYVDDIEVQTGYRLTETQRTALAEEMRTGNHGRVLTVAENQTLRRDFQAKLPYLRNEWSRKTGKVWPTVEVVRNGKIEIQNAQAHHIIPVKNDGPSAWWNIAPATQIQHANIHSGTLKELQKDGK